MADEVFSGVFNPSAIDYKSEGGRQNASLWFDQLKPRVFELMLFQEFPHGVQSSILPPFKLTCTTRGGRAVLQQPFRLFYASGQHLEAAARARKAFW